MKQEKLHWFLVEKEVLNPLNNQFIITLIQLLHQFNRVLKLKKGERVVLFDGQGNWYKCEIKILEKKECILEILEKNVKQKKENRLINLFFGIPKKNKFELIIEKGTEVGITSFNPLITDRTEKLNINKERSNKILVEACEQSENPYLPQLNDTRSFEDVIQNLNPKNTFVFHTKGEMLNQNDFNFFGEVNLLIGPEGGWSQEELEIIKDKKIKLYKAGEGILKTETACIVIPFLFSLK